jgi:hypothetical protein
MNGDSSMTGVNNATYFHQELGHYPEQDLGVYPTQVLGDIPEPQRFEPDEESD